jgi:hypothetical protein
LCRGSSDPSEQTKAAILLANVYETLGEINTEHANFEAALGDLAKCLAGAYTRPLLSST